MDIETRYFVDRKEWRHWLEKHFDTADEVWLEYPKKASGKPRIPYNDAVEEALCFGWIDSTVKSRDPDTAMQRFSPRRAKSGYSQVNKERLRWLYDRKLIHPSFIAHVEQVIRQEFVMPDDILARIRQDALASKNFQDMSDSYKRIRIAYIDAARERPEEFEKRMKNFIEKTRLNKLVKGFGGVEKYY